MTIRWVNMGQQQMHESANVFFFFRPSKSFQTDNGPKMTWENN
jgi:hypothetical protein